LKLARASCRHGESGDSTREPGSLKRFASSNTARPRARSTLPIVRMRLYTSSSAYRGRGTYCGRHRAPVLRVDRRYGASLRFFNASKYASRRRTAARSHR
jgi:hypothetical protein